MDFLTLCKRVRQEVDIQGTGPATVVGQVGQLLRVVDYVRDAYRDICAEKETWEFLRSAFSVDTVADQQAYLPSACTDTDFSVAITADTFGRWEDDTFDTFRIFLKSSGAGTQQRLWGLQYDWFRFKYLSQTVPANFPIEYALRPRDQAILLGSVPNAVYTVVGDYYRVAPDLTVDADVPLFPTRFHLAVMWRAARTYAGWDENSGAYTHANNEYTRLHDELLVDQLPQVSLGDTLA